MVLAISAYFKPETLPKVQLCSFRQMTGRPCPGCGLTRAFCAISHGRIADAWYFNPFSFLFYTGAVLLAIWPLVVWRYPKLDGWLLNSDLLIYLMPGLMISLVIFGVIRMFTGPFV